MCKLLREYNGRSAENKRVLVNTDAGIQGARLVSRSKSGNFLLVDYDDPFGGTAWVRKECVMENEI